MVNNEYEEQAEKFLKDTQTVLKVEFLKHDFHFKDDEDKRDIYEVSLNRNGREFKFNFGQSIAESSFKLINENTNKEVKYYWFDKLTYNKDRDKKKLEKDIVSKIGSLGCLKLVFGEEPTSYDILACLTTSEVGTFKDFCDDFGYDDDSIKAEGIYKAVLNEYNNLKILYSEEELNKLGEI